MKLPFIALAAVAVSALFAPTEARAQGDVIRIQLDSAAVLMRGQGFQLQDDVVTGDLGSGQDEEFELELEAGRTYIIMGVCDNSCSDLDMSLTTSGGADVDSDYELDDVPMVSVEVERSGTYRLKVEMATCTGSCDYGVAVFANGN